MLKSLLSLAVYAVTLTLALVSLPLLLWRLELVNPQNVIWFLALLPLALWGVYFVHKVSFDWTLELAKTLALKVLEATLAKAKVVSLRRIPKYQSRAHLTPFQNNYGTDCSKAA